MRLLTLGTSPLARRVIEEVGFRRGGPLLGPATTSTTTVVTTAAAAERLEAA
jgi:hypothetical protein